MTTIEYVSYKRTMSLFPTLGNMRESALISQRKEDDHLGK